jgi:hypothetical protein
MNKKLRKQTIMITPEICTGMINNYSRNGETL